MTFMPQEKKFPCQQIKIIKTQKWYKKSKSVEFFWVENVAVWTSGSGSKTFCHRCIRVSCIFLIVRYWVSYAEHHETDFNPSPILFLQQPDPEPYTINAYDKKFLLNILHNLFLLPILFVCPILSYLFVFFRLVSSYPFYCYNLYFSLKYKYCTPEMSEVAPMKFLYHTHISYKHTAKIKPLLSISWTQFINLACSA